MPERAPTPAAGPEPLATGALRVLVIEDDEVVRAEIVGTLQAQGFHVTEAENGRSGLWRLWDGRPDIILCDLMMPVMDGLEVLDAIRNRPEWATIPFVFLTSCDDRASMRRAMETGADDYVTKPLVVRELLSALRAALEKHGRFESEAAKRLDQFRDTLTLALPHEFRTPLDVIFGYAEVLSDTAREHCDDGLDAVALGIRNAARQLHRITENFVLWTQLASLRAQGDMQALLSSPEPIALDLVAGTAARERAAQVGRSADLVCDLEPAPAYVQRDFLRKITVELVDNAFKFSAAGTLVRLATSCRGGRTLLTVTDRGSGMPLDQSDAPDERYVACEQGVGLGLAIVRRVVALAGGQVTVDAPANGGTTVVVTLPAVKGINGAEAPTSAA
jgi:CheY-like chemotaxis protein/anti-sigma regulatory factor (Ser/Thr protein kinase)